MQVCTYSIAATHQVVDVQGYFAPDVPGGLGYTAATPQRMVDTRECWTNAITSQQQCAKVNAAGSVMAIRAPVGAEAVLVNLTLTGAQSAGFASADRCSTILAATPRTSNANVGAAGTAANLAVVPVGADGMFCVYVSVATHVVVDLQGIFSAAGQLRLSAVAPARQLDSREPGA